MSDPADCGEKISGTGPDAIVSYTPCPGDEEPVVTDPYDGAQKVEPTPGMSGVNPTAFDKAVVGKDGKTLTIFFWSGVEPCYVLDHVDVDEGRDAITVTLFQGHDASVGRRGVHRHRPPQEGRRAARRTGRGQAHRGRRRVSRHAVRWAGGPKGRPPFISWRPTPPIERP